MPVQLNSCNEDRRRLCCLMNMISDTSYWSMTSTKARHGTMECDIKKCQFEIRRPAPKPKPLATRQPTDIVWRGGTAKSSVVHHAQTGTTSGCQLIVETLHSQPLQPWALHFSLRRCSKSPGKWPQWCPQWRPQWKAAWLLQLRSRKLALKAVPSALSTQRTPVDLDKRLDLCAEF